MEHPIWGGRINCVEEQLMAKAKTPGKRPSIAAKAQASAKAMATPAGQTVTVAESAVEGTRLAVGGERVPPPERAKHEAELRERCLRRLRADGMLST